MFDIFILFMQEVEGFKKGARKKRQKSLANGEKQIFPHGMGLAVKG